LKYDAAAIEYFPMMTFLAFILFYPPHELLHTFPGRYPAGGGCGRDQWNVPPRSVGEYTVAGRDRPRVGARFQYYGTDQWIDGLPKTVH
jgi:hypothetical protein